jgi:hypothetical protein
MRPGMTMRPPLPRSGSMPPGSQIRPNQVPLQVQRPSTPQQPQAPPDNTMKRKIDQVAGSLPNAPRPKMPNITPAAGNQVGGIKPMVPVAKGGMMPPQAKASQGPMSEGQMTPVAKTPQALITPVANRHTPSQLQPNPKSGPSGNMVPKVGQKIPSAPNTVPPNVPKTPAQQFNRGNVTPIANTTPQIPKASPYTQAPVPNAPKAGQFQTQQTQSQAAKWNQTPPARAVPTQTAPAPNVTPQTVKTGSEDSAKNVVQAELASRKLDVMVKSLINEWEKFPPEHRMQPMVTVARRLTAKVPVDILNAMVEEFLAVITGVQGPAVSLDEEPASCSLDMKEHHAICTDEAGAPAEETPVQEETTDSYKPEEPAAPATPVVQGVSMEALEGFLNGAENQKPYTWLQGWAALQIPKDQEATAVCSLLEVASRDSNVTDIAPKILVELVRTRKMPLQVLDEALHAFASKLEELVQTNENAWHLASYVFLYLFPKTRDSSYGFLFAGFTWQAWWQIVEQSLSAADRFRAFDIVVLLLQMMQDRSNALINKMQVWIEGNRTETVQKVLCNWGQMDKASIIETLSAYGIEL